MIITTLEDCLRYETLIPNLQAVLDEINQITNFTVGRYEAENGFYMIQKGTTTPQEQGLFETHQKYIDLQIVLAGEEILYWADKRLLTVTESYDETKDLELYCGKGESIRVHSGTCYFMFPEDGHKACTHIDVPTEYTKLVYKIKIK